MFLINFGRTLETVVCKSTFNLQCIRSSKGSFSTSMSGSVLTASIMYSIRGEGIALPVLSGSLMRHRESPMASSSMLGLLQSTL